MNVICVPSMYTLLQVTQHLQNHCLRRGEVFPHVSRSEILKDHLLQHLRNLPATAPPSLLPFAVKKGAQNLQQFTQVIWLQRDVIKQKASAQQRKEQNVRVGHD